MHQTFYLVVGIHFVSPLYDPSWLTGCITSSICLSVCLSLSIYLFSSDKWPQPTSWLFCHWTGLGLAKKKRRKEALSDLWDSWRKSVRSARCWFAAYILIRCAANMLIRMWSLLCCTHCSAYTLPVLLLLLPSSLCVQCAGSGSPRMWPALTKGLQSRWGDREITGENIMHIGVNLSIDRFWLFIL